MKPLKINEEQSSKFKAKYLNNKYKYSGENSSEDDDFSDIKNKLEKSDDEDERRHKHSDQDESDQLKVCVYLIKIRNLKKLIPLSYNRFYAKKWKF